MHINAHMYSHMWLLRPSNKVNLDVNQTKDAKRFTIFSIKISIFLDSTMCNQLKMFFYFPAVRLESE